MDLGQAFTLLDLAFTLLNFVFTLLNLALWLSHYLGRNNSTPKPTNASSPKASTKSAFDWTALEDLQLIREKSDDGTRSSPGHTMQNESDTKDEGPSLAARFSDGKLVIESEEVAAQRNAADINRWRQGLRGVSG